MKDIISSKEKQLYKIKVMTILADVYYDRDSVLCEDLPNMAEFLYQYANLGPRRTKDVASYLQKVYEILTKENDLPLCIDGVHISLAYIDKMSFLPCFENIKILTKELFERPINLSYFNNYTFIKSIRLTHELLSKNNDALNDSFRNKFNEDIISCFWHFDAKERYTNLKKVESFISEYYKNNEEDLSPKLTLK